MSAVNRKESKSFHKILVANRGEIACRVIKTANQLGYQTVAIYSEADASALHVRCADQAVNVGPPEAAKSYLNIDKVLQAAKRTGADAIHPGYGFLSENSEFARRCQDAGLVFIGPSVEAIEVMGNKAAAKRLMLDAEVPCVPGYQGEDQSDAIFVQKGAEIGFPIMVKAAAGGGGKGMRLVQAAENLPAALLAARSEAMNAFGSDELILERAVIRPRHVEIQVFGDSDGNVVHLGERDCSMQRRHQKVVEESPSPAVNPALRQAMGDAAINAAKAIRYQGAGTVEFLLCESGEFYFLEMNTRLQVEHPVTEMVTGYDLVAWQLDVAAGKPLPVSQQQIELNGHAIEVRLYAEDPYNKFLPATGQVQLWHYPQDEWVRVDHALSNAAYSDGAGQLQTISPYYDPMVAKIICWGSDREQARRRLVKALQQTTLLGLPTNKHFLVDTLQQSRFIEADVTTAFIDEVYTEEGPQAGASSEVALALASVLLAVDRLSGASAPDQMLYSPALNYWSNNSSHFSLYQLEVDDETYTVNISATGERQFSVVIDEHSMALELIEWKSGGVRFRCNGIDDSAFAEVDTTGELHLDYADRQYQLCNQLTVPVSSKEDSSDGDITAVMHGVILRLMVTEGESVKKGSPLLVLEAMKMEHEVCAPIDGVVNQLSVEEGVQVQSGQHLLEVRELVEEN